MTFLFEGTPTLAIGPNMLKDGWKNAGTVFVLALVLDVVYQILVMRFVYPGEAFITAVLLAIVPYLLLRGLVTRFTRKS